MKSEINYEDEKDNKTTLKNVLTILIAFVLFLCLAVVSMAISSYVMLVENSIVTNDSYISSYTSSAKGELQRKLNDMTLPANIPPSVINNIFSSDDLRKDITNYIEKGMEGENYSFETTYIKINMDKNLAKYLKDNSLQINDEQRENYTNFKNDVCRMYEDTLKISYVEYYSNHKSDIKTTFWTVVVVGFVLAIVAMFSILKIQTWAHRFVKCVIFVTIALTLFFAIVPSIVLLKDTYSDIMIEPEYFYETITASIRLVLKSYVYLGLIWGIATLLLLEMYRQLKIKKYNLTRTVTDTIVDSDMNEDKEKIDSNGVLTNEI